MPISKSEQNIANAFIPQLAEADGLRLRRAYSHERQSSGGIKAYCIGAQSFGDLETKNCEGSTHRWIFGTLLSSMDY